MPSETVTKPTNVFVPRESPQLSLDAFDLPKQIANYEKNPRKAIQIVRIKVDKRNFKLSLNGETTTNGILVSSEYNTHSVGFKFDDADDLSWFENLDSLFEGMELEEWTFKDIVKGDQLWIKFKFPKDKSTYLFDSNVKLNPKKPSDCNSLRAHSQVELLVEISAWFNLEDKTYGLTLNLVKLTVDGAVEEEVKAKRVKTE
jgi:hypothetical protein